MRVPKSRPDNLVRNGKSVRVWGDSWAKLSELARIKGAKKAETFDALVTEALQAVWDRIREEGGTPKPIPAPEKPAQPAHPSYPSEEAAEN